VSITIASGHLCEDLFPAGKEEISGFNLQHRPAMILFHLKNKANFLAENGAK
jgi:hypothetical protein